MVPFSLSSMNSMTKYRGTTTTRKPNTQTPIITHLATDSDLCDVIPRTIARCLSIVMATIEPIDAL